MDRSPRQEVRRELPQERALPRGGASKAPASAGQAFPANCSGSEPSATAPPGGGGGGGGGGWAGPGAAALQPCPGARCLPGRCKRSPPAFQVPYPPRQLLRDFQSHLPYQYLHYAQFKANRLEKAVAAAYTFLQKNPKHAITTDGLLPNLEAQPEEAVFLRAAKLYNSGVSGAARRTGSGPWPSTWPSLPGVWLAARGPTSRRTSRTSTQPEQPLEPSLCAKNAVSSLLLQDFCSSWDTHPQDL
ncbi:uncharacterized protein LOC123615210 [Camelus bactrianus]|uniref:Uncharacterized protein LOC123615210 n=1 Tax=Camelus bactrianus TaxID=9837 RepID=A0AC58NJQ1_CAMBA